MSTVRSAMIQFIHLLLRLSLHLCVHHLKPTCARYGMCRLLSRVIYNAGCLVPQAAIGSLLASRLEAAIDPGGIDFPPPIGLPLPRHFDRHLRSTTTSFQTAQRALSKGFDVRNRRVTVSIKAHDFKIPMSSPQELLDRRDRLLPQAKPSSDVLKPGSFASSNILYFWC